MQKDIVIFFGSFLVYFILNVIFLSSIGLDLSNALASIVVFGLKVLWAPAYLWVFLTGQKSSYMIFAVSVLFSGVVYALGVVFLYKIFSRR